MILFLDFDGVLHPIPTKDRNLLCHIPRLEDVLREFPHVQVVISSLWRATHDLPSLQAYFSEDIRPRIIGVTPFTEAPPFPGCEWFIIAKVRHAEIMQWIKDNNYTGSWLALDDAYNEFPDDCPQLIECITEIGFGPRVADHLRSMLREAE